MSRSSMRDWAVQQLRNAEGNTEVLEWEPKAQPLTDLAICTTITSHEQRDSFPRGGGFKRVEYQLGFKVQTGDPDEVVAQQILDVMLEQLITAARQATLPATITDARTGEVSTVLSFGEIASVQNQRTEQLLNIAGDEADVLAVADLMLTAREVTQG